MLELKILFSFVVMLFAGMTLLFALYEHPKDDAERAIKRNLRKVNIALFIGVMASTIWFIWRS